MAEIAERAEPGDVVLYEPEYLAEVVDYYAPGVDALPVGAKLLDSERSVFVLATERVINAEDTSARLGQELAVLDRATATSSTSSSVRTCACGSCNDRASVDDLRFPATQTVGSRSSAGASSLASEEMP